MPRTTNKFSLYPHFDLVKVFINPSFLIPSYLNLPILLRCENISPPGTYSITIYKLELSYGIMRNVQLGTWNTLKSKDIAF